MIPGTIDDMRDLDLLSSDLRLKELIESDEWKDIKNMIEVMYSWVVEELVDEEGVALVKLQGKCLVLREIGQQVERYVNDITDVNFALEVDDDEDELLDEE